MENGLARRVATLQAELAARRPAALAANTGAEYDNGRFLLDVWGTAVALTFPDFAAVFVEEARAVDPLTEAILAYYFHTADGTPPAAEWIAFTELPHGRFYTSAFQGYTGRELGQVFGNDLAAFAGTAVACGGRPQDFGDRAFCFPLLPLVPVLVAAWAGDEDFPIRYTAVQARRAVSEWLLNEVSYLIGAEAPTLILHERPAWRVPVWLTLPGTNHKEIIGVVDVDVETGTIIDPANSKSAIEQYLRQSDMPATEDAFLHELPPDYIAK